MAATALTAPPADTPMMPGVGHGVTEQTLPRCSGNSQSNADRSANQYEWKPDLLNDELLGAAEPGDVKPEERQHDRGNVADRYMDGAKTE